MRATINGPAQWAESSEAWHRVLVDGGDDPARLLDWIEASAHGPWSYRSVSMDDQDGPGGDGSHAQFLLCAFAEARDLRAVLSEWSAPSTPRPAASRVSLSPIRVFAAVAEPS